MTFEVGTIESVVRDFPAFYGDIPTWIASIIAVIAIWFGYKQLKQLNISLKLNSLSVFLQIENEMNGRKVKMLECVEKLNEARSKSTKQELAKQLEDQLEAYLCLYLNGVDRLAFCIRRDYIHETEAYDDYRPYFIEVIENYPQLFGADTKYHNVKHIHDLWNDSGRRLKRK